MVSLDEARDRRDVRRSPGRSPGRLVHFWAAWDGYDRTMDAILRRLHPDFADRIEFRSCEIDDLDTAPIVNAAKLHNNPPALACFIRGKHHETMVGLRPEQDLRAKLASWFRSDASEMGSVS